MRVAVTGRTGQVSLALLAAGRRRAEQGEDLAVTALGRPDLDLADPTSVRRALHAARPDAIVSAAAYTAVDKAEAEPEAAYAINAAGAGAVAQAAADLGVPVVHLSTDYVFDGRSNRPYVESDPTGPATVYGASKLAGERSVAAAGPNHAILRTAWVYSPFGQNFVRTMLRLAETNASVRVVADQHGNPTSALDIAEGVLAVVRGLLARPDDIALRGVFHMTGQGEASWADFAEAIFEGLSARGGPAIIVKRIGTAEFPRPAPRPANSRLDCKRLTQDHGIILSPWRGALERVLDELVPPRGAAPERSDRETSS